MRRSDPSNPGIVRRRCGRGFTYRTAGGTRIDDPGEIARIRNLAIPPAWRDVWICADHRGHLQAVGTDDADRRQYLYHEGWTARRSRAKFEHMVEFAKNLAVLRTRVDQALAQGEGPTRERVLAAVIWLLDHTCFRIGSPEYASEHGTHGLLTVGYPAVDP